MHQHSVKAELCLKPPSSQLCLLEASGDRVRVCSPGAVLVQMKPGSCPVSQPLRQASWVGDTWCRKPGHQALLSEVKPKGQKACYRETSPMGWEAGNHPLPSRGSSPPCRGLSLWSWPHRSTLFSPSIQSLSFLFKAGSCSSFNSLLKCHRPCPLYLNLVPSSGSLYTTTLLSSWLWFTGIIAWLSHRMSTPGRQKPSFH